MHSSDSREIDNVGSRRLCFVLEEISGQPKRFLLDTWNWKGTLLLIGRFALGPVLILWRGVKVILSGGTARTPAVLGEKTTISSHNQA